VDQAYALVLQFTQMLRTRTGEQLDNWLSSDRASQIRELQALCDITNFVPGSLHLDWRPQLQLGYHLREPGQVFRPGTKIKFFIHIHSIESRSPGID